MLPTNHLTHYTLLQRQTQKFGLGITGGASSKDIQELHPKPDWTKVHRNAYIKALATSRARELLNQVKKGCPPSHLFSPMISRSYSYSYFSKEEKASRRVGLQAILGKTRIYDYYPKFGINA